MTKIHCTMSNGVPNCHNQNPVSTSLSYYQPPSPQCGPLLSPSPHPPISPHPSLDDSPPPTSQQMSSSWMVHVSKRHITLFGTPLRTETVHTPFAKRLHDYSILFHAITILTTRSYPIIPHVEPWPQQEPGEQSAYPSPQICALSHTSQPQAHHQ